MSFHFIPGVGTVHFNEVKPPRVVPGNERHKWNGKPAWGEQTTCKKCGCIKRREKPAYIETYQMPGQDKTTERPACQPAPTNDTDEDSSDRRNRELFDLYTD